MEENMTVATVSCEYPALAVKKEETHGLSAADMKLLIDAAQNRNIGTLIPVPRNKSYTENPGETEIASTYIYNYIDDKFEN